LRQAVKVSRLLSQYTHQGLRRAALRLSQSEGLSPSGCRACRVRRRLRCLRLSLSKGPRRRPPSRAPLLTPARRRSPRPFLCLPSAPRGTAAAPRPASTPARREGIESGRDSRLHSPSLPSRLQPQHWATRRRRRLPSRRLAEGWRSQRAAIAVFNRIQSISRITISRLADGWRSQFRHAEL
jgi:hypothetical protein